jgi:hypothetical protein
MVICIVPELEHEESAHICNWKEGEREKNAQSEIQY